MSEARLILIAKAPLPGKAKTRLTPPFTPQQASALARAALDDTIEAASASAARELVAAFEGDPEPYLPDGIRVIPQRGDDLGERLAAAFEDIGGPALLIGMDTPQVTPEMLDVALALLESRNVDAVLGHTFDGGWWAIGFNEPIPGIFEEVPMSTGTTGAIQERRLSELGLRYELLPMLRDVDVAGDAEHVARSAPHTRFAATFRSLCSEVP